MDNYTEITFWDIEENKEYVKLIEKIVQKAFEVEHIDKAILYLNIILTNPMHIREINREYRKVDKATDVLSFPMFEKEEIENIIKNGCAGREVLGDIMISIPRVAEQAVEYGHSFERELAYMVIHEFYHLMGYDHMEEEDKKQMREKEENVLNQLNIVRK